MSGYILQNKPHGLCASVFRTKRKPSLWCATGAFRPFRDNLLRVSKVTSARQRSRPKKNQPFFSPIKPATANGGGNAATLWHIYYLVLCKEPMTEYDDEHKNRANITAASGTRKNGHFLGGDRSIAAKWRHNLSHESLLLSFFSHLGTYILGGSVFSCSVASNFTYLRGIGNLPVNYPTHHSSSERFSILHKLKHGTSEHKLLPEWKVL